MRARTASGRDAIADLLEMNALDYQSEKPTVPNFESHALIHSLGGIVAYSHPCRWWRGKWGGQGHYPVEQNKFISNMAPELPFDTICGPTYDAIDIMMQPNERIANEAALKLWFLLLDHGYHIAASGSSDATFDNPAVAYREECASTRTWMARLSTAKPAFHASPDRSRRAIASLRADRCWCSKSEGIPAVIS